MSRDSIRLVLAAGAMFSFGSQVFGADNPMPDTRTDAQAQTQVAPAKASAKAAAPAPSPAKWVQVEAEPVEIDGRTVTPTCSGAEGSDPAFSFWYQKGTSDGLVVFFDGGGACWSDETCSKPRLAGNGAVFEGDHMSSVFKAMILPGDDPTTMSGLFDTSNPSNPVRDWSKVFISYCTGDVHSGSKTMTYTDPKTGKPFTIEHRGWDNGQAVAHWIKENLAKPSRVLICGSSAGAYGALTHFATIRGLFPDARAFYLGDGGMGVTTPAFEKARNASWNYTLPASVFGPDAQNVPDSEALARLAAHFPKDRFAQYTAIHDVIQTDFFGAQGGPRTKDAWTDNMLGALEKRQSQSNFRSYVAAGAVHTILRAPGFYSQNSAGMPLADWIRALLNDEKLPANMRCSN